MADDAPKTGDDQAQANVEAGDDAAVGDVTVQQGDEMVTYREGVEVGRVTIIDAGTDDEGELAQRERELHPKAGQPAPQAESE